MFSYKFGTLVLFTMMLAGIVVFESRGCPEMKKQETQPTVMAAETQGEETTTASTAQTGYTAVEITREADTAARRFAEVMQKLDVRPGFVKPSESGDCPLTNPDKRGVWRETTVPVSQGAPAPVTSTATPDLHYAGYDKLFRLYGECIEVDWRVFKGLAWIETRYQADAENPAVGLFQTKPKHCRAALQPHGLEGWCDDLIDPENATMAAMVQLREIVRRLKYCQWFDSATSQWYFLYLGYHGGIGLLRDVLPMSVCDHESACRFIFGYWQTAYDGRYASITPVDEVCGHPPPPTGLTLENR